MSERRGPGRPREDGARRRTLTIRITEADRQLLGIAAERAGRSVSTAVRDAAIVWACGELGLPAERVGREQRDDQAGGGVLADLDGEHECTCGERAPEAAECMACGARDCPHGEPLHYHHDGCPSCEITPSDPPS